MRSLGFLAGARFWTTLILASTAGISAGRAESSRIADTSLPWGQALSSGQLQVGIHFGDQQVETFGDVLVPILQRQTDLIFINPRGAWNDDDGQEFNFGLGARHLFPDKNFILGGNIFYDRRDTALDNTFNQVGLGLEFLSRWLDARANYYFPDNGEKTADNYLVTTGISQDHNEYWYAPSAQGHVISQYGYEVNNSYAIKNLQHYQTSERAMAGFDAEIGSILPVPVVMDYADIKVFIGYFSYHAHAGNDLSGAKGRIEVRPVPAVYLDAAWFEEEALYGLRYSVGARVAVPFDLARLSRGQNPFADTLSGFKRKSLQPSFASRLTEMVIRDLHVRTEVAKPAEVVADRRVLEKTLISHSRKDYTEILAEAVTFVCQDNRSGLENGTWENPYRQINTGVQGAMGSMVYVREAKSRYYENVVLHDGLTLWGSGAPIYGRHGVFQGDHWPVVNGGGIGPAVTVANQVKVTGFELIQPAGIPSASPVIFGKNVTDVSIVNNTIRGNGSAAAGIELKASGVPSFSATVSDNRITGASGNGIDLTLASVPLVRLVLDRNTVSGNGGDGAGISAIACDDFFAKVAGHYSGNGGIGVNFVGSSAQHAFVMMNGLEANGNGLGGVAVSWQAFPGEAEVELSRVTAHANGGDGLFVDAYGYNGVNALFSQIDARHNSSDGLHAVMVSGGSVKARYSNNRLIENGGEGWFMDLNSGLESQIIARGNQVHNNVGNGVNLQTLAPWDSVYDWGLAAEFGVNSLHANGAYQMLVNGLGTLSASGNWWGTPTPVDTVDYRALGGGAIVVAPALPAAPIP